MHLNVLLRQISENRWQAISLERCVVAGGTTEDEARHQFGDMLASAISYGLRHGDSGDPLAEYPEAPEDVWLDWKKAIPYEGEPVKFSLVMLEDGEPVEDEQPNVDLSEVRTLPKAA